MIFILTYSCSSVSNKDTYDTNEVFFSTDEFKFKNIYSLSNSPHTSFHLYSKDLNKLSDFNDEDLSDLETLRKAILNYACIKGQVKLVLFDDRKDSKSFGKHAEYILTPSNYFLII